MYNMHNVDGSCFKNHGSAYLCGGIMRNINGDWILGLSSFI